MRQANSKNALIFWDRLARIIFTVKFMWRKYKQNGRNTAAFYFLLFISFPVFIDVQAVSVHGRYQSLAHCRHCKYCISFQNSPLIFVHGVLPRMEVLTWYYETKIKNINPHDLCFCNLKKGYSTPESQIFFCILFTLFRFYFTLFLFKVHYTSNLHVVRDRKAAQVFYVTKSIFSKLSYESGVNKPFFKGPGRNYFRHWGCTVSVATTQLCFCSVNAVTDYL